MGPTQLKKNAVVRAKIKNNAVNGSKVARNPLSGDDVKESTLAKVPASALADAAGHANSSAAVDKITYKTRDRHRSGGRRSRRERHGDLRSGSARRRRRPAGRRPREREHPR